MNKLLCVENKFDDSISLFVGKIVVFLILDILCLFSLLKREYFSKCA